MLEDFIGAGPSAAGSRSYDISPYIAANTQVRVRLNAGYSGANAYFYADKVDVAASCTPPPSACNADYTPGGIDFEFSTAAYSQRLNRGVTYFPAGQALNGVTSPAGGAWVAVGGSGILWLVGMDGTELDGGYATGLSQLEGIAFVPAPTPSDPGHLAIVKGSTLYYSDMSLPANASYTIHALSFVGSAGGITYIDGGTYDGDLAIADQGSGEIHIVDQGFGLVQTLATGGILSVPEGIAHLKYTDKFLVVDTGLHAAVILDTGLVVSRTDDLVPFSLGGSTGAAAAIQPQSCDHVFGDRPNNRYAYLNTGAGGGGGGGGCNGTYRDEFNAKAFDGSDGTLDWSTSPWVEVGESDGPTKGDERVRTDVSSYQLRIRNNDNGGEGVERQADLSGAGSATLSFDYRRQGLDTASDYVAVQAYDAGAAQWQELARIAGGGTDPAYQSLSRDLTPYIAADARIRFVGSSGLGNKDEVWIDNVQIQCGP